MRGISNTQKLFKKLFLIAKEILRDLMGLEPFCLTFLKIKVILDAKDKYFDKVVYNCYRNYLQTQNKTTPITLIRHIHTK